MLTNVYFSIRIVFFLFLYGLVSLPVIAMDKKEHLKQKLYIENDYSNIKDENLKKRLQFSYPGPTLLPVPNKKSPLLKSLKKAGVIWEKPKKIKKTSLTKLFLVKLPEGWSVQNRTRSEHFQLAILDKMGVVKALVEKSFPAGIFESSTSIEASWIIREPDKDNHDLNTYKVDLKSGNIIKGWFTGIDDMERYLSNEEEYRDSFPSYYEGCSHMQSKLDEIYEELFRDAQRLGLKFNLKRIILCEDGALGIYTALLRLIN